MPAAILAWLAANWLSFAWKIAVPVAIWALRKLGVISWANALEDRLYAKVKLAASEVKTEHEKRDFPGGVDGKPDTPFIDNPGETNISNVGVGGYHDEGPHSM